MKTVEKLCVYVCWRWSESKVIWRKKKCTYFYSWSFIYLDIKTSGHYQLLELSKHNLRWSTVEIQSEVGEKLSEPLLLSQELRR